MYPHSSIRTCIIRHAAVVLAALVLAACAGTPSKPGANPGSSKVVTRAAAIEKLQKTPTCCASFADFKYARELPAKTRPLQIGPGRPVANFNGTRSYFVSLRLPKNHTLPYKVLLKSDLNGGHWLHSSYLFAPSVVLLDSRYRLLRTKDVQLCEYIGWTHATSGAFGSVTIRKPEARYMVIYSSGRQLHSSTYWEQSPANFSADAPVSKSGSYQVPHGPDGKLYVGLLTDRYAGVLDEAICGKRESDSSDLLSTLRSTMHPSTLQTAR